MNDKILAFKHKAQTIDRLNVVNEIKQRKIKQTELKLLEVDDVISYRVKNIKELEK